MHRQLVGVDRFRVSQWSLLLIANRSSSTTDGFEESWGGSPKPPGDIGSPHNSGEMCID